MQNEHQPAKLQYRYPGVTPFTTGQQHLFFGRKQDTDDLYQLIRREALVVLYGKSGLGKSSLLNAGIVPACLAEGTYTPLVIRFGAWTEGSADTPLGITKAALAKDFQADTFLQRLLPGEDSLWYHAKKRQLNAGGRPLLLFDQFEELFSYPEPQILAFQQELAELRNTSIPLRFRRRLETADAPELREEEEDQLESPLETRILFAIRSDRMHLLNRLSNYLPNVLRHSYELNALALKDARDAIVLPASYDPVTQGLGAAEGFVTQPFHYTPAALERLVDFLRDEQDGRIEGILLQMLCEHYERKLVEPQRLTLLDLPHIGEPEEVVRNYYEEKLQSLPPTQQPAARRFIEDGLVSEGEAMRLTLHESYIAQEFKVDKNLLETLVDSRLLRSEPFLRGGYTYELSHDRLVPAVLKARTVRRELETLAELAKERRKRRSAIVVAMTMGLLACVAIAVAIWALSLQNKAEKLSQQTTRQKVEIQANLNSLEEKEADLQWSLKKARAAQDTAEILRIEANLAKIEAQANLAQATQANERVAASLLKDVDKHILNMEYDQALEKINAAAGLKQQKNEVFLRYLEIAFWYNETGQTRRATGILDTAATFIGKGSASTFLAALAQAKRDYISPARKSPPPTFAEALAQAKRGDLGGYYAFLMRRYYPYLIPIKGGTFEMGCDSVKLKKAYGEKSKCNEDETLHTVTLSNYSLAETETTWWQFGLYLAATGKNVWENRPEWQPTGDHPIVRVSWNDAIEYANWVTQQFAELKNNTVYTGDLRSSEVQADWTKKGFRLPTEAEWEYAAGAAGAYLFAGTSSINELYLYANSDGVEDGYNQTAPVKTYRPNAFGLYDMSGNVWEWCWDWFGEYSPVGEQKNAPVQNPTGAESSRSRVLRGGSWDVNYDYCRVSYRDDFVYPVIRLNFIGFRLSRVL